LVGLENKVSGLFFLPAHSEGMTVGGPNFNLYVEHLNPTHILLLFGVGAVASIINIVAGGGSYLSLPLLIFTGLPAGVANATNRVGILAGNLVGSVKFARAGKLRKSDFLYFCLPAAVGGLIGAKLATLVDDRSLRIVLAVLMLFGSWTVIRRPPKTEADDEEPAPKPQLSFPLFTGVGIYAGFIQAGTGFFSLAATGLLGHDLKRGNAIKTLMNTCLTIPALLLFAGSGMVNWPAGLALAVGMSAGSYVGVKLSQESKPEHLKKMVAGAILISAVFIIYPLFRG
jgi:uncharacterized membrane protein YfcA